MKKLILIFLLIANIVNAQEKWDYNKWFKKTTKFSTLYAAVNGGTSLSDVDVFSVNNGLSTQTIETPYD